MDEIVPAALIWSRIIPNFSAVTTWAAVKSTKQDWLREKKVKVILQDLPERDPELPDVPTMAEAGLPDFHVLSWNGLAAPAGTPKPIIDKLNREVNKILNMPEVRKQLQTLGGDPIGGTPEEFARFVDKEIKQWGAVVKSANFSLD